MAIKEKKQTGSWKAANTAAYYMYMSSLPGGGMWSGSGLEKTQKDKIVVMFSLG